MPKTERNYPVKAQKFTKKPVTVEAMQYTGGNINDVARFVGDTPNWTPDSDSYPLETLEGTMDAHHGDWIIKGVAGEFYPCKPDIFEQTYERAEMARQKINAAALTRTHIMKPCRIEQDGKTYAGILRHFTHAADRVCIFLTSADNAVIIGSLRITPQHEIEVTP